MKTYDMDKYLLNSKGFTSIMRKVPMSNKHLKCAKDFVSKMLRVSKSQMYVIYRGPTNATGKTLKKNAHSFDLYLLPNKVNVTEWMKSDFYLYRS